MPSTQEPRREANRVNYRLRSTFFLRKLKEYDTLSFPAQVQALLPFSNAYNWDARAEWGIGEDAFEYIASSELALLQVFCHPKLLREHPQLLAYYRNVAALSQKSVGYLIGKNVTAIERNLQVRPLSAADAQRLATLFNEHITLIVDSSIRTFTLAELNRVVLASTGAQIDGSWRNAIGEEAERVVQKLLIKEALERSVLYALIHRATNTVQPVNDGMIARQIDNIEEYKGFQLTNQTSLLFSSEPDISLIGPDGGTQGVIEVKGGADPAGALERFGAAKKSFDETRRDSPNATTILVASCITTEVETRIQQDPAVTVYYNLTQILSEDDVYKQFVDTVFLLLNV